MMPTIVRLALASALLLLVFLVAPAAADMRQTCLTAAGNVCDHCPYKASHEIRSIRVEKGNFTPCDQRATEPRCSGAPLKWCRLYAAAMCECGPAPSEPLGCAEYVNQMCG